MAQRTLKRRLKLRDLVPFSQRVLDARTAKFLSRSPEFHTKRKPQWWNITDKLPKFPAWTNRRAQSPCLPFESGTNMLPGFQEWYDRMTKR